MENGTQNASKQKDLRPDYTFSLTFFSLAMRRSILAGSATIQVHTCCRYASRIKLDAAA